MTKAENMKNTAYMLEKRSNMMLEQARTEGEVSPAVEKFLELLKDEAFAKDFANCASAEAMKELLDQNGVEFSMEEIDSLLIGIGTLALKLEENNGELSEEELEMIAGGFSWTGFWAGVGGGILMAAACTFWNAHRLNLLLTSATQVSSSQAAAQCTSTMHSAISKGLNASITITNRRVQLQPKHMQGFTTVLPQYA